MCSLSCLKLLSFIIAAADCLLDLPIPDDLLLTLKAVRSTTWKIDVQRSAGSELKGLGFGRRSSS